MPDFLSLKTGRSPPNRCLTRASRSESPIPGTTMWIEDEELRSLYKISSAEHLQTIEDGLLHLEKHPDDEVRLTALMRVLHTLKGDSRMVGVGDAETLAHQIEDLLGEVERGDRQGTPELYDRLHYGLDSIRAIANEAITGDPANVEVFYVMAHLMGAEEGTPGSEDSERDSSEPDDSVAVANDSAEAMPALVANGAPAEIAEAIVAEAAAAEADLLAQFHAAVAQISEE
ncbi:MAG: Hpt domain-containing protein, partial [Cyanobacteria bacterium J06648_11]